ncbi:uncharacterized protein BDV17DRAFT_244124 [Aspergillus undulatus]|uniref:uncharacterized protein n=1 Tax=Aspergillus undulatus TaxID=1810928 RepID=UPI003CCCC7A6
MASRDPLWYETSYRRANSADTQPMLEHYKQRIAHGGEVVPREYFLVSTVQPLQCWGPPWAFIRCWGRVILTRIKELCSESACCKLGED